MLRLYRRHRTSCAQTSENYRRCQCPIYVKGTLGGAYTRMSMDQTNWDAATTIVATWVKAGRVGPSTVDKTVSAAVDDFLKDAVNRGLSPATLKKYRLLLTNRLVPYCEREQYLLLASVTLDVLSKFRASWPVGALARQKTQERVKAFFGWCQRHGWITDNPAVGLSPVKVTFSPTMPFTAEEQARILAACDVYPKNNKFGYDNRARMKAMVLLLRWSGLRIRDAVTLEWDRIQPDGTLFLYTQKTGTPVAVPLHHECLTALNALPKTAQRIFWITGATDPESTVRSWQRSLRVLFKLAQVAEGHAHRFRDTFAVDFLMKGVELLDVSMLLGHASVRVTEKHYAPWVTARQTRLASVVRATWGGDTAPVVATGGTPARPLMPESATPSPSE